MNTQPPQFSYNDSYKESWTPAELIEQDPTMREGRTGALGWWYRLTSPGEPTANASFDERELARRGRLASTIMFFFCLALVIVLSIGLVSRNPIIAVAAVSLLIIVSIALLFNRRGHSNVTGLIVSFALNLALITVILTSPGGLSASSLGLFDLLVFVELFVASLLPANWVFVAALANIAFIVVDLFTQHRTADFAIIMATSTYPILVRPIMLHVIVTVVLWLWVRNATQAIARADRAEVIASLEHTVAEQERVVAQQKRQLDVSVHQIIDVHMRVANGDFNARVPLTQENILWQVAGSLNNLLARFQRLRQEAQETQRIREELQKTREVNAHALHVVRGAKASQHPILLSQTGTLLDPLLRELSGHSLTRAQPPFQSEERLPNLDIGLKRRNISS